MKRTTKTTNTPFSRKLVKTEYWWVVRISRANDGLTVKVLECKNRYHVQHRRTYSRKRRTRRTWGLSSYCPHNFEDLADAKRAAKSPVITQFLSGRGREGLYIVEIVKIIKSDVREELIVESPRLSPLVKLALVSEEAS